MVNATRSTASPTRTGSIQPPLDWWAPFAPNLMQAQCVQLEALISWQQSLAAINKEMWDEWACRWAGGVPIDAQMGAIVAKLDGGVLKLTLPKREGGNSRSITVQ